MTLSRKFVTITLVFSLVVTNIMSLVNNDVYSFLYAGLSKLPITELLRNSPAKKYNQLSKENTKLTSKLKSNKGRIKLLTSNISTRSLRNVTMNMLSVPAETVPLVGAGVVVMVTAVDVKDACDTMADINNIRNIYNLDRLEEETVKICGYKINFNAIYNDKKNDLNGFIAELKETSTNQIKKFNIAVGGTTSVAIETLKNNTNSLYDKIGGTIYFLLND